MTPAEQLARAIDAQHAADQRLIDAVIRCRTAGWSWADIAAPLGLTRAAVFARYRHLDQQQLAE